MKIKRGQVVKADLGVHTNDSIQGGIRPVIVVSNNRCNNHSQVITVVPLTTRISTKKNLPTHVLINAAENKGLKRNGLALCEQLTILPIGKIVDPFYGEVNEQVMNQVTEGIMIQTGVYAEFN